MSQKTLLKDTKDCVKNMLAGISEVYPGLSVFPEYGITFLNKDRGDKVAILSGGGSGHEPFPAGYIADNMITGTVSGHIFTSPSTANIFKAINILNSLNKGGVLVAILNYTGDQLNFGLAIERAKTGGIQVESISVSDDIALLGTDHAAVTGNRGICGCTFIFKLLGAMSESGKNLQEIMASFEEIKNQVASMGACLVPCRLPNSNSLLFHLNENEISLGCGVHGEAGISTIQMCPVEDMVAQVLDKIFLSDTIKAGNRTCVLIGNLGSLTPIECFVVANVVKTQLNQRDVKTERIYVGTVMSSLDMKGFQVSVLNITEKEEWLSFLDTPTAAFGWPGTPLSYSDEKPVLRSLSFIENMEEQLEGPQLTDVKSKQFQSAIIAACKALKNQKDKINELDSGCGDGDCGSTLEYLANGILSKIDSLPWRWTGSCLQQISKIAELEMGGTSGAVYSLLLAGAAKGVNKSWHDAWSVALQTLYSHSPARVGHRTLVDALAPASEAYTICIKNGNSWKESLKLAVEEADRGCQRTATMAAKLGRASYAASTRLKNVDAGAFGVTVWLKAVYNDLI